MWTIPRNTRRHECRTITKSTPPCYPYKQDMLDPPDRLSSNWGESRRTQRVVIQIPILVRAPVPGEPPLEEDTFTLVVNAHGALISLAMKVRPGQKLVLRNWANPREQDCRVVHVRDNPFGKNEVGVSFPFANPHFWNLEFPPPGWTPAADDKKVDKPPRKPKRE